MSVSNTGGITKVSMFIRNLLGVVAMMNKTAFLNEKYRIYRKDYDWNQESIVD